MYMLTINLILIFMIFKLSFCMSNQSNEIKMLLDVIKSYEQPTGVVAKVCWKKSKQADFASHLAENKKLGNSIRFISQNTESLFTPKNHIMFIVDLSCPGSTIFLNQANTTRFQRPYRWIILADSYNSSIVIPHHIINLNIMIDSNVILAQSYDNNRFILYTIYKNKRNAWLSEYFGIWSPETSLMKSKEMETSTPVRRKNLAKESISLSIVISEEKTKYELDDLQNVHIDTIAKLGYRHTEPLYDFINATRIIKFTDTWGYYVNGSWNGMVGDLVNGETELAGSVMFITEQRLGFVEFLSHPVDTTVKFVFREPPLSYQNNLFLLPFKSTVWYCTAAFIVILILILYVNAKWEAKKLDGQIYNDEMGNVLRPNFSDVTILVVSAVSQQGSTTELRGNLGRLVMFILFLTFLFLYTSYSASIVVFLQSSSNQIKTLKDLLNSRLELGVEDIAYNRYFFTTATEPVRKAIYETKVAARKSKPNFMSLEEGVRRLQKTPFAFNMNLGTGYRIVEKLFHEHEKCGLQEIEYIQENVPWLTCGMNSPYKELFKIGLFRIQEHGLTRRVNHLMLSKKPVCAVRGGNFVSVNMIDCYPAILILVYGMIFALCILLLEIFIYRYRQKVPFI